MRLPESNPAAYQYLDNIDQALNKAKVCLDAAQQRQKKYADTLRSPLSLAVGDKVLLSTEKIPLRSVGSRKLLMKWMGPYTVVRKVNEVAHQLELPAAWRIHNVFHVSLLKPYLENGRHQPPLH